jgi:hypothetical protein
MSCQLFPFLFNYRISLRNPWAWEWGWVRWSVHGTLVIIPHRQGDRKGSPLHWFEVNF